MQNSDVMARARVSYCQAVNAFKNNGLIKVLGQQLNRNLK